MAGSAPSAPFPPPGYGYGPDSSNRYTTQHSYQGGMGMSMGTRGSPYGASAAPPPPQPAIVQMRKAEAWARFVAYEGCMQVRFVWRRMSPLSHRPTLALTMRCRL